MTDPSRRSGRSPRLPGLDELRLLTKVARLYHERGVKQPQIARDLSLSQPRVSRLLKQASELGIVRTVVTMPLGVHGEIEDAIREAYGLRDVLVVDAPAAHDLLPALGAATAAYLDMTLTGANVVGISSWSQTLIASVDRMPRKSVVAVDRVVQLLGGHGDPAAQVEATRLMARFAELTGAMPIYLPAPGVVASAAARRAIAGDRSVAEVADAWDRLTDAVVGIGALEPSPLVRRSGLDITETDLDDLRSRGAVGDVCFRWFDERGVAVKSPLDRRVIGITAAQLAAVPRRIGVAGGADKQIAVRAALRGLWVDVLITDLATAQFLMAHP